MPLPPEGLLLSARLASRLGVRVGDPVAVELLEGDRTSWSVPVAGTVRDLVGMSAYLQVGAMLGTVMVGNVFFVIIPDHWKLVRAKEAGQEPDPRWNREGKTRSVHNNYLTLPVLLAMLSSHFDLLYGHSQGWLILVALMALGALTRHYFNLRHRGLNVWPVLGVAAAGVVALALILR